ncbi:MAG TPA: hypothetical protein VNU01_09830, partial [Egibacteraceae bacterium]|nr:hypothetical protein [Egibacteraceae bacterium]
MRGDPVAGAGVEDHLDEDLAGLDKLDTPIEARVDAAARLWSAAWPKLVAVALALAAWQAAAASGWR